MEKFTASNGWELRSNGSIYASARSEHKLIGREAAQALAGMFQAKRDQELGRWRWPENPNYLVYLSEGGEAVWVLNEREAGMLSFTREMSTPTGEDEAGYNGAARAYFAAHPEPKPWHDAKPGEVWVVRVTDEDMAMTVHESVYGGLRFRLNDQHGTIYALDTPSIREGRRIWPEGE